MQSPGMAFADTFMRGFSLMDAYYSRQKTNERADKRDARQKEAHTLNMSNATLQNKKLMREDWANQYQNIVSDDKGNAIDLSKLSADQLQAKKQQFVGFLNGYEPIKADMLKQNPNRESVESIDLIMDKQTGQPMMAVNFKMKDGSVKPMTVNSSADPKDNVQLVGLGEVDNMVKGYLGQDMGIKPTMKEARATQTAANAATLDHSRKVELAHIKAGSSPKGGPGTKQANALKKSVYSLNNSNYGSAGLGGQFSFEGDKAQKRNVANVVADHLINSGQGTDAGSISAQAVQQVDQIYSNGGQVSFNKNSNQWEAWDGSFDESGSPINVIPLNSDYKAEEAGPQDKPQKKDKPSANKGLSDAEFNSLKKRADNGDRDASIALSDAENGYNSDSGTGRTDDMTTPPARPASFDEYLAKAKEVNPGVSDDEHRAHYDKKYGGREKAEAQARKNIDARKAAKEKPKDKGKTKYEGSLGDRDKKYFDKQNESKKQIEALDNEITDLESKLQAKDLDPYVKKRYVGRVAEAKRLKAKLSGKPEEPAKKSAKRSRTKYKKNEGSLADATVE